MADTNSNKKVLVSACLIGRPCRYDGKHQQREEMMKLHAEGRTVPVCPEEMGGLPTPRPPAERQGDKVITNQGVDVTSAYQKGATEAAEIATAHGIDEAYLKSKSPMCGCNKIYDGQFKGQLVDGDGVLTEMLKKNGVKIHSVD